MNPESFRIRCYTSYSGVGLPLNLVNEISDEDLRNRNTYYQGCYDLQQRLCICRKIVYAETEFEHRYSYHPNGQLKEARIQDEDGEITQLQFDEQGKPV